MKSQFAMTTRMVALALLTCFVPTSPVLAAGKPDLEVTGAWVRAMPPGADVAAGYLTAHNQGKRTLRIVGVKSPIAASVDIHEMKMDGGKMQMRALPNGLAIAPGRTVQLEPGGNHLMFMEVKAPVHVSELVPITLLLDDGSSVRVDAPVKESAP